jgi:hypothetical protein
MGERYGRVNCFTQAQKAYLCRVYRRAVLVRNYGIGIPAYFMIFHTVP